MKLTRKQARECGLDVPGSPPRSSKARNGPEAALKKEARQKAISALAMAHGLLEPTFEHPFGWGIGRKWRFDIAWLTYGVAIEIQGGLFVRGRHVQGAALLKEYEKLNMAQFLGWRVFLFTPRQIDSGEAFAFVRDYLEERL